MIAPRRRKEYPTLQPISTAPPPTTLFLIDDSTASFLPTDAAITQFYFPAPFLFVFCVFVTMISTGGYSKALRVRVGFVFCKCVGFIACTGLLALRFPVFSPLLGVSVCAYFPLSPHRHRGYRDSLIAFSLCTKHGSRRNALEGQRGRVISRTCMQYPG